MSLGCCILMTLVSILLGIVMLIGQVVVTVGKALPGGGVFYVGNNLVSWHSKKQNSVSLSTAEAEYVTAGSCCTQLLWMRQMLEDYGFAQSCFLIYCDNMSGIDISKNPVQHSRTKHVYIRHHFIRDLVEDKILSLEFVPSEKQLADILTKALDFQKHVTLR